MKTLSTLFPLLFIGSFLFGQAPQKMSYQAVIRNSNNALVTGSAVGMRISILQGSTNGQAVYVERHTPTTNANGLATIEIGGGTVVSGNFLTVNWANGPFFIKTETDPTGGTAYSITGTTQLLSVPYAIYAKTAETVLGGGPLSHYVGEIFGGGVVFHVYRDVNGFEHGLIVSLTDLGNASWGAPNILVPNCSDEWNGSANTTAILAAGAAPTSAAGLCGASTLGNQTDWYLPSIRELKILGESLFSVNKTLETTPGATIINIDGPRYWSSTSRSATHSYSISFNIDGSLSEYYKDSNLSVRAVRSF